MDDMAIDIEPELSASDGEVNKAIKTLIHKIKSGIGVSIKVNVKNHGEVPRSQGKAQRVVDKRTL
jgi:phenylacetate-CoA ligase